MTKTVIPTRTQFDINESYVAENMEDTVTRILSNKEPITVLTEPIFTRRMDGVNPWFNIRTDRFDMAVEDMDKATRMELAKRDAFHNKPKEEPPTAA